MQISPSLWKVGKFSSLGSLRGSNEQEVIKIDQFPRETSETVKPRSEEKPQIR